MRKSRASTHARVLPCSRASYSRLTTFTHGCPHATRVRVTTTQRASVFQLTCVQYCTLQFIVKLQCPAFHHSCDAYNSQQFNLCVSISIAGERSGAVGEGEGGKAQTYGSLIISYDMHHQLHTKTKIKLLKSVERQIWSQ